MKNKINIKPFFTIEDLQNQLNKIYPYLKIEFYKEPHISGKGTSKNQLIKKDTLLNEIQKVKKAGTLIIDNYCSVSAFENAFEKKFGLHIQVFRKSGNVWIETSATDGWTLVQQNEEGEMLAEHFKKN